LSGVYLNFENLFNELVFFAFEPVLGFIVKVHLFGNIGFLILKQILNIIRFGEID
jgi:hypothetical protein